MTGPSTGESTRRSREIDPARYDTDKITFGWLERYDSIFQDLVDRDVRVLELGILNGGSLLLWRDYFRRGLVVGIDLKLPPALEHEDRIRMFQGSQGDTAFLSTVASSTAPEGFDIIVDDASHLGELTRVAFWHLFDNHLKPSGLYLIEDWGTGYWHDWPDGRRFRPRSIFAERWLKLRSRLKPATRVRWHNHSYGMVGFVKELVDEQGVANLTRASLTGVPKRNSRFDSMTITDGMVIVRKRAGGVSL